MNDVILNPKFPEPPQKAVYTCSVCGKVSIWGDSWSWYGSYKELDDGKPIITVCSEKCKKIHSTLKTIIPH